jgi:apolipoprotein N-acyltransferase
MFKKIFLHGVYAGILTILAAVIYNRIYYFATEVDFSHVLSIGKIAGLSMLISMIAAVLNYILIRLLKKRGEIVFNSLFSLISFAAVMIPISILLPLNVKSPELFPGLAVPMVFFPSIAWYTLNPFFANNNQ